MLWEIISIWIKIIDLNKLGDLIVWFDFLGISNSFGIRLIFGFVVVFRGRELLFKVILGFIGDYFSSYGWKLFVFF